MTAAKIAAYGSWKSPVTADLIVARSIALGQVAFDGADIYWTESRPTEGGRNVIVRRGSNGVAADVLPMPYNARTRAHEYGGGAYAVADGVVYFSNFIDQRLYRVARGGVPEPITAPGATRFADSVLDKPRRRLIAVAEDNGAGAEPVNSIVAVDLTGPRAPRTLISGADFYSSPCLSPDGKRLAWLSWDHPNMPWDGTRLWLADVAADGGVGPGQYIAGGDAESIFQPVFSPDGVLHFVSDRSDWWNLYRNSESGVEALLPRKAEFGLAQWVFGMSTYAFAAVDKLVCAYQDRGAWSLGLLDTVTRDFRRIDVPFTDVTSLRAHYGTAVFIGGSPLVPPAIVRMDVATGATEVLRSSTTLRLDGGYTSQPETIDYPTHDGKTVHAFYYPPQNSDYRALPGERPPLLVLSHGGPTAAASSAFDLKIQYWTSRGFAVVDVNYRGSTGYGRRYRCELDGSWGVADVEDCVNAARYLVKDGRVDGARLAIRGASAGGFTTLSALTSHRVFHAGASYYGVSDLEALARDTHKFESHYLDRLIGPYPARRELYLDRSPIQHADKLSCPAIFFQGLEDRVVPPDQTERMVQALRDKGLPVAYVAFEGEQHGFRKAESIKRALEAELYFYARIFGFSPAGAIEPVAIENL